MTTGSQPMRDPDIDWSLCTWEGARLAQMRAYRRLSLFEKLEAVEQMCDVIRTLRTARKARGLPVDETDSLPCGDPTSLDRTSHQSS